MDCSHQAPLSMRFLKQEHWSGFPFPSPVDLPHPGTQPPGKPYEAIFLLKVEECMGMLEALQNNFLTGFSTPFRFILILSTNSFLLLTARVSWYLTLATVNLQESSQDFWLTTLFSLLSEPRVDMSTSRAVQDSLCFALLCGPFLDQNLPWCDSKAHSSM